MRTIAIIAACTALSGGAAVAQAPMSKAMDHSAMAGHETMAGMQRMHDAMMKANDRDAGRAYALKMIEHHRGAVEMSQTVIKHSPDTELKKMAEKTIRMQRKEIGELQSWLDRHGGRTPNP